MYRMLSRRLHRIGLKARRGLTSHQLQYESRGDPTKKVKLVSVELGPAAAGSVTVEWLAAPLNPADMNMIQGTYPLKPPLPAVGGNEGVGRVHASTDSRLPEGTIVIPASAELGTWRQFGQHPVEQLLPLANVEGLSLAQAATLLVNPPTAYRMLHDFQKLEPGDTVVQNGANSAVGKAVIQIAAKMGVSTVNVIRGDRADWDEVSMELRSLGGTFVISEEELRRHFDARSPRHALKKVPAPPKLALNCVGGRSTVFMAAALGDGGSFVTYGGMSKMPNSLPIGAFIFKDIEARGFWMSRWYRDAFSDDAETRERTIKERDAMLDYLMGMMREGKLKAPSHDLVPLEKWGKALSVVIKGTGKKQILQLSDRSTL